MPTRPADNRVCYVIYHHDPLLVPTLSTLFAHSQVFRFQDAGPPPLDMQVTQQQQHWPILEPPGTVVCWMEMFIQCTDSLSAILVPDLLCPLYGSQQQY